MKLVLKMVVLKIKTVFQIYRLIGEDKFIGEIKMLTSLI